jgi:hypothetical protein
LADQKISELTALTGANVADDDAIAIVDTSATETKKIVFSELKNALDTATGFVRITGDTMTGALDVQSTVTADGLIVEPNTSLYTTDATISNYSTSNGIYINGHSGGWLALRGDGTGFSRWTLFGGTTGDATLHTNNKNRIKVDGGTGDISFYEDTGTTPKFFWDASAESLGIGTSSPEGSLHLNGSFAGRGLVIDLATEGVTDNVGTFNAKHSAGILAFQTNSTERMRIDSSGNVGIGVTPSQKLHVKDSSTNAYARITATTNTGIDFGQETNGNGLINLRDSAALRVFTSGTERMRIDSSGNVGIGVSSISGVKMDVLTTVSDNLVARFENSHSTGSYGISVKAGDDSGNYSADFANKSGTSLMRIRGDGNVGIGTSSPSQQLTVSNTSGGSSILIKTANTSGGNILFGDPESDTSGRVGYSHPTNYMYFNTNGSERMRIDSSGKSIIRWRDFAVPQRRLHGGEYCCIWWSVSYR